MYPYIGCLLLGVELVFGAFSSPLGSEAAAGTITDLAAGFAKPPHSARPWAYWWWLDGNASKAGITGDLEAMRRQGIGGVLLFDAGQGKGSPVGPRFMSPAWRTRFAYAGAEAQRLGIDLSLNLCSGWDCGGTWVTPDDACKKLVYSRSQLTGPRRLSRVLPTPPVIGGFYRDIAVVAFPAPAVPTRHGAKPNADRLPAPTTRPPTTSLIKQWLVKSGRKGLRGLPLGVQYERGPSVPGEVHVHRDTLLDISSRMDRTGRIEWDVPKGTWSILRIGYTLLGAKTKCSSPGSQGYEIDFLSAKALDRHFEATANRLLKDLKSAARLNFKYVHDDSWELGNPTWTPNFRAEFKSRRGYDPLPYLAVLAGEIVDSRDVSNRFLWDYRRTIADCIADHHYGRLATLAHRHGMGTHPEAGGPFFPHIDALLNLGKSDIPMGEFWARKHEPDGDIVWSDHYGLADTVKQAAAAAHIYGKRLAQAEAFTTMGPNWEKDPFMLKDIGDRAFCQGLTRNVLCFYVHQPRLDIKPGYQWEAAGTHFDRNITWWGQIHAWLDYLSRCQFLLQQGRFVADVCYFYGEDVPNFVPARARMQPRLPVGYDCDTTNADVLLHRMRTDQGRIVLPDGMRYRLLVLPERETMGAAVLRKIATLVAAGATVVGPPPRRAPGLRDYPACDVEVRRLARSLWGPMDGRSVTHHRFGKGRVIWGKPLSRILADDRVAPDFSYASAQQATRLDFIHRALPNTEIYFVANQRNRCEEVLCTFRTSGKVPELWAPDTGRIRRPAVWDVRDGCTRLPLRFDPRGSVFVVFRHAAPGLRIVTLDRDDEGLFPGPPHTPEPLPAAQVERADNQHLELESWRPGRFKLTASDGRTTCVHIANISPPTTLAGPWQVTFPKGWGAPKTAVFPQLISWTRHANPGIKYFSGTAVYHRRFDVPKPILGQHVVAWIDLGRVQNVAEVTVNGHSLGVLWKPPFRVNASGILRPTGNQIDVAITNLWPNRLIGDQRLPPEERFTVTNVKKFKKDSPLLESGLLGPVTIRASVRRPVAF